MHVAHASSAPAAGAGANRLAGTLHRYRPLLLVLAAGVLVRVVLLFASASLTLQIVDEQHYATLAASLLRGDGFAWGPGEPTSMRPPLYPAFVALVWQLAGAESLQAIRAAQIPLSLLMVTGVYLLASRLFDRRVATVAAAIVCFYPGFLFAGVLVLTEILFTLLLVALVLQYHSLMTRPSWLLAASIGATVGLAALTRSVLWPFPVVLIPMLFVAVQVPLRQRAVLALCCALGFIVAIGPWTARNVRLQHTFTVVDTMGGMNLRMGNYEYTPEDRMWDAVALMSTDKSWSYNLAVMHPEATGWTDGQKEKWAQREALKYMAAHPGTTLRRMVLKFADFWGLEREMVAWFQHGAAAPPAWILWPLVLASALVYPLTACSAAVGVWCARLGHVRTHVLMIVLMAFIAGVHTVVFGHSRYHLPLVPILAIYAGAAWVGWRSGTLTTPGVRLAGAGVTCAVLLAIWSYELLLRDADRLRALLGAA